MKSSAALAVALRALRVNESAAPALRLGRRHRVSKLEATHAAEVVAAAAACAAGTRLASAARMGLVMARTSPQLAQPRALEVLLLPRLLHASLGALVAAGRLGIAVLAACGRKCVETAHPPAWQLPTAQPRVYRPAHGRPSHVVTSIIKIHRHRWGHRAKIRGAVRRHATP